VLLVPQDGRGQVRQLSVPLRQARAALAGAGTVAALGVLALAVQFTTLPRVLSHDALVAENVELRARLDRTERELDAIAGLVQRVRVYDEHLRSLDARNSIPGFGPLDPDEQRARQAWLDGRDLPETDVLGLPSERSAALEARAVLLAAEISALAPVLDQMGQRLDALETVRDVLPVTWPLDPDESVISSNWGWRRSPFRRGWTFHAGLDLAADHGTPILATNDGLVAFSGWEHGYGYMIDLDHGGGVITRYAHASRLLVEPGDAVTAGDVIALVGSTGSSTGAHLHYELRFDGESVEPLEYLP
jgi:murein DD-endopeptidase MepM/ murein hydrolase activator NlpD